MSTGEPLHRIFLDTARDKNGRGQLDSVTSLSFSGDSKHLISTFDKIGFHIYKTECGSLEWIVTTTDRYVYHIDASLEGDMFASAHGAGTVALWSISTGERLRLLLSPVTSIAENSLDYVGFSADSRYVAAIFSGDDKTCVWDTTTGHLVRTIQRNKPYIPRNGLVVLNSSSLVPSAWECEGKVLSILDVGTGQSLTRCHFEDEEHLPSVVSVSPDYKYLTYETKKGRQIIRFLDTGCHYRTLEYPFNNKDWPDNWPGRDLVFSRDGKFLVHSSDNTIHTWSMAMLEKWSSDPVDGVQSRGEASNVSSCSVHRKMPEHLLISVGKDDTIKLWSTRTGHLVRNFRHSLKPDSRFVEFSPDFDHMFMLDENGCGLWRARESQRTSSPEADSDREQLATSSTSSTSSFHFELIAGLCMDNKERCRWNTETAQSQLEPEYQAPSAGLSNIRATANHDPLSVYNASWPHYMRSMMESIVSTMNPGIDYVWTMKDLRYATTVSSDFRSTSFAIWPVMTGYKIGVLVDDYDIYVLGEYWETDSNIIVMALSNDLSRIVTVEHTPSNKNSIRVWSMPRRQCVYAIEIKYLLDCVAFSPDGRSILTERGSFRVPDSVAKVKVRRDSDPEVFDYPQWHGYGFDEETRWITWNGLNIISLPGAAAVRRTSYADETDTNPYPVAQSVVCDLFVAWIDESSRLWMTGFCPTEMPFGQ